MKNSGIRSDKIYGNGEILRDRHCRKLHRARAASGPRVGNLWQAACSPLLRLEGGYTSKNNFKINHDDSRSNCRLRCPSAAWEMSCFAPSAIRFSGESLPRCHVVERAEEETERKAPLMK